MPVTYYSSTGAVSFAPVPAREQAVGPLEVAVAPSPPDDIIEAETDIRRHRFNRSELALISAASTAVIALMVTVSLSAG